MDWARSETKGGPAGSDQYELGGNDGRPGGELRAGSGGGPVRSILWFILWFIGGGAWTLGHHPRLGSHQGQVGHRGCQE